MAYRVTKTHQGITASADYPTPPPANLAEMLAANAMPLDVIVSGVEGLNLSEWPTYSSDILAVLNADPVSQSFDQNTQTLTIVKDWPSKDLHDKWESFMAQVDWSATVLIMYTTNVATEEV